MSQLENKRTPTNVDLDAYNKILALAKYSMGVCKPRQKKNKYGKNHDSRHHVPARHSQIGESINAAITEFGAMILEANAIYVANNLNVDDRRANYDIRIRLQTEAIAMTYKVEHTIRVLHEYQPFADSTIGHWMFLLCDARQAMIKWKDSDVKKRKNLD